MVLQDDVWNPVDVERVATNGRKRGSRSICHVYNNATRAMRRPPFTSVRSWKPPQTRPHASEEVLSMKNFSPASAAAGIAIGCLAVALTAATAAAAQTGKQIYMTNCSTCHQANGQGLPRSFPPLAHNNFVTGKPAQVIQTILNGKQGAITVNGKKYDGQMPAWKSSLSTADIANVATYIRTSWGNHASKVTTNQVAQAGGGGGHSTKGSHH